MCIDVCALCVRVYAVRMCVRVWEGACVPGWGAHAMTALPGCLPRAHPPLRTCARRTASYTWTQQSV